MRCMAFCTGKGTTKTPEACGGAKETAFTHKHLSPEKEEETSQLGYNNGPRRRADEVYICNGVRTWATWDHHTQKVPVDEEQTESFPKGKRKKKWTGWKPKDRRAKNRIQEERDGERR